MLCNLETCRWDDELLDIFGIPASMLPEIVPSSCVVDEALPEMLGAAIPVAGIAGDQQAATFGQACFEKGMAKNTYGTGCFMPMNTGTEPVFSDNGSSRQSPTRSATSRPFTRSRARSRGGLARAVAARQPGHDRQVL